MKEGIVMKNYSKLMALLLALVMALSIAAFAEEGAEQAMVEETVEAEAPAEETPAEEAAEAAEAADPEAPAEEAPADAEEPAEEAAPTEAPAPESTPAPLKELSGFIGTHFMSFVNKIGDMWPMQGDLIRYENEVLGVMTDEGTLLDLMVFRTGGSYTLYGISTGMTLDDASARLAADGWEAREEDGWLSGTGTVGHRFDRGEGAMIILFADDAGVIDEVMAGTQVAALKCKIAEVKEFTSATPTPEPTATPDPAMSAGGTIKLKGGVDSVNVRSGAGTGYDRVAQMYTGDSGEYLGEAVEDESGVCWYKIEFNGKTGYVSAKFTSCTLLDGTFITSDRGTLDY